MAYEDKDLQFLYELLQKHIKYGKTSGMSLLEEIVSGVDLITHELKEANAFAAKTQNAVNKQMEKIKELKDKITSLEVENQNLKSSSNIKTS